jgi:hypothetical protein
MSQTLVRRALESAIGTWASANSQPVQWQNVVLDPEPASYVRAFILPAQTEAPDVQQAGRSYTGTLQVSIVRPQGEGPATAETLAASLSAALGMRQTSGGVTVHLLQPLSPVAPINEPGRYVVPCTASYSATVY